MEKQPFSKAPDSNAVYSSKVGASSEQHEIEASGSKFMPDRSKKFQKSELCSTEASSSWDISGHNLQSDQPSKSLFKDLLGTAHNIPSYRRESSVRIPETKILNKQAENYKQEFREHHIERWMSRHRYAQELMSKSQWLGAYPQQREDFGVSGTAGTVNVERVQDLGKGHHVQQQQIARSSEVDGVEYLKKQVRFVANDAIIDEQQDLQHSKGASVRKRKIDELNPSIGKSPLTVDLSNQETVSNHNANAVDMTLREWLSRPARVVDCFESLNIFKQIIQFVDLAHMQGVVLKNIRPSSFILSSLHRVSFLDSTSSSCSSGSSEPSTGGACIQSCTVANTTTMKAQNISQNREGAISTVDAAHDQQEMLKDAVKPDQIFACTSQEPQEPLECKRSAFTLKVAALADETQNNDVLGSGNSNRHAMGSSHIYLNRQNEQNNCFPLRTARLTEDMWYTSPEEIQNGTCSFASDIYSLGVLFFELFSPFHSWDEHSRLMLDLRHRILPPYFLSDHPKEAAFCLWLLHPEPNSRPKTRDILSSEIINDAGEALSERQNAINIEEKEAETVLLLEFLLQIQQQKQNLINRLQKEITCLASDIMEVRKRQSSLLQHSMFYDDQNASSKVTHERVSSGSQWKSKSLPLELYERELAISSQGCNDEVAVYSSEKNNSGTPDNRRREEVVLTKSARLMSNFDKFEEAYFAMRSKFQNEVSGNRSLQEVSSACGSEHPSEGAADSIQGKDLLGCFFDSICKYARYSRFEVKATLLHGNLLNSSNMVCSLSFDRDQEYFATAGICKRIRIFDCDAVINEDVDIHYPVVEMMANSKLSSICWNSYIKSHVASSDYDGVVQLWDASTAQPLMQYKEHKKRAWSVDFSQADPTKLASGSDDCTVKLWSINQEGSIGTIKTEANVCCVQFPGDVAHLIAFGSADYKIYCYDLRNMRHPWCILANHSRAVSYVKFIDSDSIISASTDNTLKLWDISKTNFNGGICRTPTLTYTGHTNEKNFVGLSVLDGYIACGSETNAVFAYHKSLPMPIASHKFGCMDPLSGKTTAEEAGKFVSSVCWRAKSQMLVAANSMGNIKVLEMV